MPYARTFHAERTGPQRGRPRRSDSPLPPFHHRIGTPRMSASQIAALCALLPALATEIAADAIGALLAAVPRLAGNDDPARTQPALVGQLADMHPRDWEEAMLAVQSIAAFHGATLCTQAAAGLDPASKEASRLRRDAAVQQRRSEERRVGKECRSRWSPYH